MTEQSSPQAQVTVRPATFSDADAINRIHQRNGLGAFQAAAWRARWEAYPFHADFTDVPIGWVLETEAAELVGTIGSIQMLYELDGQRLRGAIATDWAVDASHRGKALHLTTAFFKQKGVDILINGSASPTASKVLTGLQIPRIPIPDYNAPCFWAASPQAFARATLQRRGIRAASVLSFPLGLILRLRDLTIQSGRGKLSGPVSRVEMFDARFDALWPRIAAGPGRLRAVRTRAVLEWRFGSDLESSRAAVLCSERSGAPAGYIVLLRRAGSELGMGLYDVADLQAVNDDPSVYRDLLVAAVQLAREEGVDAVKLMTGSPAKRLPALTLRPYSYRLPFWQLYFRASPKLKLALASPGAWDFSSFETY